MIGDLIKYARKGKKMTTTELAKKAGITQSMVSRYESGKVIPTQKVLQQLSTVLEIDFSLPLTEREADGFDQKEFDSKLAKAKTLGIEEKKVLLGVVDAFLKIRDTHTLLADWSQKKTK